MKIDGRIMMGQILAIIAKTDLGSICVTTTNTNMNHGECNVGIIQDICVKKDWFITQNSRIMLWYLTPSVPNTNIVQN